MKLGQFGLQGVELEVSGNIRSSHDYILKDNVFTFVFIALPSGNRPVQIFRVC